MAITLCILVNCYNYTTIDYIDQLLTALDDRRYRIILSGVFVMEPSLHQSLPPELQIMSFQLRLMKLIGLVGPKGHIHRFFLAFGWATFVILFPKTVLGFGSTRFDAITKGLAELLFEGNLFIVIVALVLKLPLFKRMVHLISYFIRQGNFRECLFSKFQLNDSQFP